jgi:hypothetical protein
MQDYRLYILRADHISRAEALEAESDQAAVDRADELRGDEPAELWNRARVVTKFFAAGSERNDGVSPAHGRLACGSGG